MHQKASVQSSNRLFIGYLHLDTLVAVLREPGVGLSEEKAGVEDVQREHGEHDQQPVKDNCATVG